MKIKVRCSYGRPLSCAVLRVLLLSIFMRELHLGWCQSGTGFCSRVASTTRTACPSPPTVSSLRIQDYLGTYYEIGSTAGYKLRSELGAVCSKANQTLVTPASSGGGATFKVVFSGRQVGSSEARSAVAQISAAASSLCSKGRQICAGIAPGSGVRQALASLSVVRNRLAAMQPQQATALTQAMQTMGTSLGLLEADLDSLARQVSSIQRVNGRLNEGSASTALAPALRSAVAAALLSAQTIGGVLRGNLTTAGSDVAAVASQVGSDAAPLEAAVAALSSNVGNMTSMAADIEVELGRVGDKLDSLITTILSSGSGLNSTIETQATLVQQGVDGHMVATMGGTSTHWDVLAIDRPPIGGLATILVYSCAEAAVASQETPSEGLLLFSRTPQVPRPTIDRLLAMASGYGIPTDCDSPFLPTLQLSSCM